MTSEFWDERYSVEEMVYGEVPNDFLVEMADRLPTKGRALDIGAGEGRNAVYLAARGLDVLAVDQSVVGLGKAERLAKQRGHLLRTEAADLASFDAKDGSFDVITSIFVHLPAAIRARVHAGVKRWLKPGGVFVLEAYAPEQGERDTGGPKDPTLRAPLGVLVDELEGLRIEHQAALVRRVEEGKFHTGEAAVVQVVARRG